MAEMKEPFNSSDTLNTVLIDDSIVESRLSRYLHYIPNPTLNTIHL